MEVVVGQVLLPQQYVEVTVCALCGCRSCGSVGERRMATEVNRSEKIIMFYSLAWVKVGQMSMLWPLQSLYLGG